MPSSADMDKQAHEADAAVLRIVGGLHAGASRPLSRREMVLIGSGDDCDVVLADIGVAAHHALLNIVDGRFHLRALDAPISLPERTLHPGDPVEISHVQRIGLGQAAIAFGRADAPEWLALAPEFAGDAPPPRKPAFVRRMPLIAGIAVLALAGLAIFAAWMPAPPPPVDVEQRLHELAREHGISDVKISRDVDGRAVLSGTVGDRATRPRIGERIAAESLPASVSLRSGEDLAIDVAEVMRSGGYAAKAEYIGDNSVRVTGHLGGDRSALEAFIRSRAMVETGVNRVEPVDLDEPVADAATDSDRDADAGKVHIVSIVRGEIPYIVDADGNRYHDGANVPGWGELVSIGQFAHVIQADGTLVKLTPSPAPPPPPKEEEAADGEVRPAPATNAQRPSGRVHEHEGGASLQARMRR